MTQSEIKFVRSLRDRKVRDAEGLFVVEGEKMVAEAVASALEVVSVFRASETGPKAMERITNLSSPSPVLAVVRKPEPDFSVPGPGLYLALDSLRDPGNLGTVIRIADWFGIKRIFASEDSVDVFNPKVVQSTMGAIFRVGITYTSIPGLCRSVAGGGGKVYGTFLDGSNLYGQDLDNGISSPSVIVIGNEAHGISKETAREVTHRLYIPPYPGDTPGSESLNAAVATAITVAEFRRRG